MTSRLQLNLRDAIPSSVASRAILISLAIVTAATSVMAGGTGALVASAMGVATVLALATVVAERSDRHRVAIIAVAILMARLIVTSVLHVVLQQQNEGGAMFEDDFGYVQIGAVLARMWSGEAVPVDQMPMYFDPSTVNAYSRSVGALFLVFGPNVAVAKIGNTLLLLVASLFLYRATLVLSTRRAALVALGALALWPSLSLWTSLTLKEGMALFCATGATWAATEMLRRPRVGWFVAVLAFTLPLQDARPYLHAVLLMLWPAALVAARLLSGRPRFGWGIAAAAAAAIAISGVRPGLSISPEALGRAEDIRAGMAEGANSAVVEATRQFEAKPGSCLVVRIPDSDRVGRSQKIHLVAPNTPLVYADRTTTDIKPPQGGVKVLDGDIVCIAGGAEPPVVAAGAIAPGVTAPPGVEIKPETPTSGTSPVPTSGTSPVPTSGTSPVPTSGTSPVPTMAPAEVFVTTTGSTRLTTGAGPGAALTPSDNDVARNLAYLPRGAMLLIGAPFPWDILPYPARWPLLIEMGLWYPVAALALVELALVIRERQWVAIYVVVVGLAVGGVLSLAEGNLGTLVRHRGMLIPYAIVLASLVADRWTWSRVLAR